MAQLKRLAQAARGDGGMAWQLSIRDLRRYMDSIDPDRYRRELDEISELDLLKQIQAAGPVGPRFTYLLERLDAIRKGLK